MKTTISYVLLAALLVTGGDLLFPTTAGASQAQHQSVRGESGAKKTVKKNTVKRKSPRRKARTGRTVSRERSISVLREYLPEYADLHETKKLEPTLAFIALPHTFDFRSPFASPELRHELIRNIDQWLGVRYRYGGASTRGVDCSGFTSAIVSQTLNFAFHGNSRWQSTQLLQIGDPDSLQFGDLVFFTGRNRRSSRIGHVGIYIGNGVFAHSSTGRGVMYSHLSDGYYSMRYRWGGRFTTNAIAVGGRRTYTHQ